MSLLKKRFPKNTFDGSQTAFFGDIVFENYSASNTAINPPRARQLMLIGILSPRKM